MYYSRVVWAISGNTEFYVYWIGYIKLESLNFCRMKYLNKYLLKV